MTKKKYYFSPVADCRYAYIFYPDTAFSKSVFRVDLMMSRDEALKIHTEIKPEFEELLAAVKVGAWKDAKPFWPFKDEMDDTTDKPTGRKIVSFMQNSHIKKTDNTVVPARITYEPIKPLIIVDSQNQPITKKLMIGDGSRMRVKFSIRVAANEKGHDFRVKLHPVAFQIIKFVEYKVQTGFDSVSDGFVSDDAVTPTDDSGAPDPDPGQDDPFNEQEPPEPPQDAAAQLISAKTMAWVKWCKTYPNETKESLAENLSHTIANYFGKGTKPAALSSAQWTKFAQDNFAKPVFADPFPAGTPGINPEDIPF